MVFNLVAAAVNTTLTPTRQKQDSLSQGLTRYGSGMNRDATHDFIFFDQQHLLANLGSLNRGAFASRATANYYHVVMQIQSVSPKLDEI